MFKQNHLRGNFLNGKPTPLILRQRIIYKYVQGVPISKISNDLQISERGVRNIVSSYEETESMAPKEHYGREHYKASDEVLQYIEYMKIKKPSMYGREIKNKLLELGICNDNTVPSRQTISHVLRHELGYTRKRLSVVPEESLTDAAQEKQVRFLEGIIDFPARNMHFMDECSVDRTSGNRTYGHSTSGEPAIEICRYSSNAKFTINLMCGYFGVDHYNIIEGASNGMELVQFFTEALDEKYDNGTPKLAAGDVVIIDIIAAFITPGMSNLYRGKYCFNTELH